MSEPFIITGLPRSRTAWLAALCNTIPEAICYHEPLATLSKWQAVAGLLHDSQYRYCGASDHGLGFQLKPLMDMLLPRVLIVARDRSDVEQSCHALYAGRAGTKRFLDVLERRIDMARDEPCVRVVGFADLQSPRTVYACLRHLMPESTICMAKVAEFLRLNVQADLGRVAHAVEATRDLLPALLGADVMAELQAT